MLAGHLVGLRRQACGAVTGALMVIGLAMAHVSVEDKDAKARTYQAVQCFIREFEKAHGTVNCNGLLGHDLGNPEEHRKAKESGLFTAACPKFVESAARILEQVLDQNGV